MSTLAATTVTSDSVVSTTSTATTVNATTVNAGQLNGLNYLFVNGTVEAVRLYGPTWTGHARIHPGDSNWTGYIEFNNANGTRTGFVGYGNPTAGPSLHFWGEGYQPVLFGANGGERMRIHPDGWICMGTQNIFARLTVEGAVVLSGQAYTYFTRSPTNTVSTGYVASGSGDYTIWASNRISCTELNTRSDRRLKKDITPIPTQDAFAFINNVPAIHYKWKNETDQGHKFGFTAQDVIRAGFPNLVGANQHDDLPEETDEDGLTSPENVALNVNYDQVIPLLTTAIKEQQKMIEELRKELAELKAKISSNE